MQSQEPEPGVDTVRLKEIVPDLDAGTLSLALADARIRAAASDLEIVMSRLNSSTLDAQARFDWAATRDELIAEIKRLAARLRSDAL